ncbi:beta-lactamase/transpeptidase-like protein [Thozetella sp. PMI_491]|nr:beta-lactamase/transpeptidase-like protein [Thozetella sp. PMI_491]
MTNLSLLSVLAGITFAAGQASAVTLNGRSQNISSSTNGNPFDEKFGKIVADTLTQWNVVGISLAVVDGDNVWAEGYGFADLATNTSVTPETVFYPGSTTKAFTGATMSYLINSGNFSNPAFPGVPISWQTPLKNIIPAEFVLQDDWATDHVTIEDVLSHRSGMGSLDIAMMHEFDGHPATLKELVSGMRYLPLSAEPRMVWQYCNQGYYAASLAIETLTSRWLGDVMKEWIWEPLGMNSTFMKPEDANAAGVTVAKGYTWDPNAQQFNEVVQSFAEVSGAGAIMSNILDYAKWISCMVNAAVPFSPQVHADIRRPRIYVAATDEAVGGWFDVPGDYTVGWISSSYKGHRFWWHNGGTDASCSQAIFFPDLKFAVVNMANSGWNAASEILLWELIDNKLGLSEGERAPTVPKWQKSQRDQDQIRTMAMDALFPDRPQTNSSTGLPMDSYAGTYYNGALRNVSVEIVGPSDDPYFPNAQLKFNLDNSFPTTCELQRAVSDWFLVYCYGARAPYDSVELATAQFLMGDNGKVTFMGIEWGSAPRGQGYGVIEFAKLD